MNSGDYRQRLYDRYVEASPHYYQPMANAGGFDGFRAFYRATHGPWLPSDSSARILDVGCGSGQFCHFLQEEGYTRFEGVDASPQMLEVGRGMGLTSLRQANAVAYLKAHPCEFDAIVANDFIEHLTKPEIFEFLDGAREALRPGGRLIMKTPNAACIFGARDRYVDFTHEVIFTAESATQVLLAAGLESVRVLPINGAPPHTPRSWVRFLLWAFLLRPILALLARVIIGGQGHIHTVNILIVGERPRTA